MTTLTGMLIASGIALAVWGGAHVVHAVAHPKRTIHKLLHHPKKGTKATANG